MTCGFCDPRLNPEGPRRGEGHVAVRFGDLFCRVSKDGETIDDCYEVEAPHRAWRLVMPTVLCPRCGETAASYLDESGGFSVAFEEAVPGLPR